MPQTAFIRFLPLKTTLANLPLSIYSPLVQAQKRPQSLALHVLTKTGKASYLGWSGMSSSGGGAGGGKEWLEVDPGVGEGFGWKDGMEVEISIIHSLTPAKSISVAPLTPEDWEIISMHANYLEQNLLFHVRVCSLNQILEVWVKGKNRVRMRVESLSPTPNAKAPALLLSQDTEIIVSPMLRPPPPPAPKPTSVPSSKPAPTTAKPTPTPKLKSTSPTSQPPDNSPILRILPSRLVPLPDSPPTTPPLSSSSDDEPTVLQGWYALLSPESIALLPEASSTKPKPKSKTTTTNSSINLKLVPPPFSSSPDSSSAPVETKEPSLSEEGEEDESKKVVTLPLKSDASIPFGHVVLRSFGDRVEMSGKQKLEEWDLVRVWLSSEEGGAKEVVDGNAASGSDGSGLEDGEREKEREKLRSLPGLSKPFTKSLEFLLSSFVLQSGMFFGSASGSAGSGKAGRAGAGGDVASRILLLTGSQGSGKTTLAKALGLRLEEDERTLARTFLHDLSTLSSSPIATIKSTLQLLIAKANWSRPSVMILDGLDGLCGPEMEHVDTTRTRLIAELLISLLGPSTNTFLPGVVVIATAKGEADVNPLLGGKHLFGEKVSLGGLAKEGRREVLAWLVDLKLNSSPLKLDDRGRAINFVELAGKTEGYSVSDLGDLVGRAVQEGVVRSMGSRDGEVLLGAEDFEESQKGFVPLSLRDVKLHHSDVSWKDIGGLHDTRRVLRETLEWPTKYGAIFSQSPLRLRSGLLLYGYPGCGKTLLASAVAKECGLNFISVKGPEILNKYIGASEKSVRDLFERASAAKPCVLFFDEFDSIAPKRGHDSTGVTDRVVNQMLTQMDGAEGLDGVYVLAATSRPDLIDPALLRPGRLDKSLLCPLPSYQDRLEIIQSLTSHLLLSPLVSLPSLASQTEFFSGADLGGLIGTAHLASVHASIDESTTHAANGNDGGKEEEEDGEVIVLGGGGKAGKGGTRTKAQEMELRKRVGVMFGKTRRVGKVEGEGEKALEKKELIILPSHLALALETARPSVPESERQRLGRIYSEFVDERSPGGLDGAEGGGDRVGSRVSLG
ncbi:P-loop containing nucleoside triphosphate hydrolase protein [Mrakia frigida]|uniref:AAA family ATPase peroxin 1 n=1 Tax=Mrakia frigida TaxID=29902 RepID=UPI003FCC0B4C